MLKHVGELRCTRAFFKRRLHYDSVAQAAPAAAQASCSAAIAPDVGAQAFNRNALTPYSLTLTTDFALQAPHSVTRAPCSLHKHNFMIVGSSGRR